VTLESSSEQRADRIIDSYVDVVLEE